MYWYSVSSPTGVLATLSAVCAFFFWLEKATQWKFFQFIPPLIFIYLAPMILSNTGVLPTESPVYTTMGRILLPMLLTLLLLKLNIRGAVRVLGRGLGVMLVGSLGVMIGAPIGLLAVKHWLGPDAWKAFGSLSASWVGGSANLVAVSHALESSGTEYGLAVLADTLITYAVWLPLLLASKKFAVPFARFTRVRLIDESEATDEQILPEDVAHAPTTRDYLFLLCIALLGTWIADAGANWIQQQTSAWSAQSTIDGAIAAKPYVSTETWRILLISTVGIALSFTPVSRIHGSHELAMAFLYLFVAEIGASAKLDGVAQQAVPFLIGALIWIFIHGCFCLLGAAIFRPDIHIAAIASAANVGGTATSTIVASYHKRSLVPAAIVMALIGYAIGTYTGLITAMICRYVS